MEERKVRGKPTTCTRLGASCWQQVGVNYCFCAPVGLLAVRPLLLMRRVVKGFQGFEDFLKLIDRMSGQI